MENTTKDVEMPKDTEAPLGWQFKDSATITMHWKEYSVIMAALAPFEMPLAIMNNLKNQAIQDGKLLPIFEKDIESKNEFGQIVKLKEGFGKESTSNSLVLDSSGNPVNVTSN